MNGRDLVGLDEMGRTEYRRVEVGFVFQLYSVHVQLLVGQVSFDLDMSPWTLLWTALAVLVVALLSQLPGMRAVARLDIATVVRQRSL